MSNSNDYCNEEQMLSLLNELQTENEKLRKENEQQQQNIAELNASNSSLNAENEKMLKALERFQQDREKQQAVAPLIQTIRQQEKLLTELSASNKSLTVENEKLTKLSEKERKLNEENNSVKQNVRELESRLKRKEQELEVSHRQNEDLVAKFTTLTAIMPKVEDVNRLTNTFRGAEKTISLVNFASTMNTVFVAVFVAVVLFGAWQAYNLRQGVESVSEGVQSVRNAVYNSEGWSVFTGTVMNEEEWAKRNPEAYQRYLQEKEQRQQDLK